MANTLAIRRRIRSIRNTRQITKAMELVAATKMRRAQLQALSGRMYALLAWDMANRLAGRVEDMRHALLRVPEKTNRVAIILMSSNRGLAGSFNTAIVSTALAAIKDIQSTEPHATIDLLVLGKKGAEAMAKAGQHITADFPKVDVNVQAEDVLPIVRMVTEQFVNGQVDRVMIAYTDFISTLSQKPRLKQLLPFPRLEGIAEKAAADQLGQLGNEPTVQTTKTMSDTDLLFEPTPDGVLEQLLPRLMEVQLYQAVLETNASEHSARMVAMKNASDAARDLIDELTLEFNQMRQASITQEIAEISAGRLAVT